MKIKSEASQSEIGTDNILIRDTNNGKLGVRLIITSDDNISRYEIILTCDQARDLMEDIQSSIDSIQQCYCIARKMNASNI